MCLKLILFCLTLDKKLIIEHFLVQFPVKIHTDDKLDLHSTMCSSEFCNSLRN